MAAEDRFERGLSAVLHASLDLAKGPHPRWPGSPAQLVVTEDASVVRTGRRVSRAAVLLAAAVAIALVAALVVAGGRLHATPPVPTPNGLVVAPSQAPRATEPPTPSDRPRPSAVVEGPSPSPVASPRTCLTRWSHSGAYPPGGLMDGSFAWRIDGAEGQLTMIFLNAIDTVRQISITPANPPFRGPTGRTLQIAGTAFYRLTLRGLTRATEDTDDDMKATETKRGPGLTFVVPPIAEARRIHEPARVSRTPYQTEVWIVGIDRPSCLEVGTYSNGSFEEVPQAGDNVITVAFVPAPNPLPVSIPSPSPSG